MEKVKRLTKAEKAKLKELCEKATPDQWLIAKDDNGNPYGYIYTYATNVALIVHARDADFIASSRTAVPALLAEVEALRGALRRLLGSVTSVNQLNIVLMHAPVEVVVLARALLADEEE